jgi:uncharacterized protein
MVEERSSPAYLRGIESFNRGAYFDAHDCWEECWIVAGRPAHGFFKGLIQAAVAMHHLRKNNLAGAQKLLLQCRDCLGPCRPSRLGLDVDDLLSQLEGCVNPAPVNAPISPPFDPRQGPQIHLNPSVCALSE